MTSSHLILRDFLPEALHAQVLEDASAGDFGRYRAARVGQLTESIVDEENRRSRTAEMSEPCRQAFEQVLAPQIPEISGRLGIATPTGRTEKLHYAWHGDGCFFRRHIDTRVGGDFDRRMLTGVYYFYRKPKAFEGGTLQIFNPLRPRDPISVEPFDNSMVFFPSFFPHEVLPVSMPDGAFEDGRFSVNFWMHK